MARAGSAAQNILSHADLVRFSATAIYVSDV
jgi:hypothetical protein